MQKSYEELNVHAKGPHCGDCSLFGIGASFARTIGSGRNGVALVGEALGETEAIKGLPFQGDAGMMLNRIVHRGGFKRDEFLILNTINCHPPNNFLSGAVYEHAAIARCSPYMDETMASNPQIKVLVPMGNIALRALTGFEGIKNWHGTVYWHERYQKWVVPTLHPSFVLRTSCKEFPTSLYDISKALSLVKTPFHRTSVDYVLFPQPRDFETFIELYEAQLARDPETILAADIETAYSSSLDEEEVVEKDNSYAITRISFAFESNKAITLPWLPAYIPLVQRLLGTKGMVVFWNGNKFDVPRLRAAGIKFNGLILDGMDAWHFLRSDLPKGLGYVAPFFTDLAPWKHLNNSDPEYYSAVDADALIRIMLKLREMLNVDRLWDVYLKTCALLEPRFQSMSDIGIGIDRAVKQERRHYYENIRDNTSEIMQPLIPDDLKPRLKKKEGGYKGKPHDVRQYLKEHECTEDEAWKSLGYQRFMYDGVERWDKLEPFNYNSSQQIISYIEYKYGRAAVPRDKKTGNPTTGKEELDRLARQKNDEVLHLIGDAGNADGKITSFLNPWEPGPDGRVHGIFTNTPATLRIASQGPNLQNFPRRDEEANELRKMIIPGDGFEYLIEADYKSIEAILVGYYANDPDYMRLGYKGVHSFFAGAKLGLDMRLDMSDSDLDLAIKEAKKLASNTLVPGSVMTMYDACKQSVHGGNYLEGALLLHKTYPELFTTTKMAQEYQDFYFGLFPKIPIWQQAVVDSLHETCYVMNAWGWKRYLYNAKKWWCDPKETKRLGKPVWKLVMDDGGKKGIATNPQSSAGFIMRGAMMNDPFAELLERRSPMITIHDSLVARARDARERDHVIEQLIATMEYPIKELGGIMIPVEIKVSSRNGNWASYHKTKNPLGMQEIKR